ncbi:23334_t:CDS:2, partial [Gigaspora rosea]
MDDLVHKKRSYTIAFKLEVIAYAEGTSNRHAAVFYNIDRKRVQEWRKKKTKLENKTNKDQARVLEGRGRKAMYPALEKELLDYIKKKEKKRLQSQPSRVLRDTISSMNIRGGSLETYCETRWASIYDTANSIIRVRPAINKPDIFTNREVFKIVNYENENFYTSCRKIALIFEPIKRVITLLESYIASLADCFLAIVHLASAFRRIPISNNFRSLAITAFNRRYQEFDISPYVLTYFLHPNYRSHGLQKGKFRKICELAVNYYKGLHHSEKECRELVGQLIKYKANVTPWDLEYSLNLTPPLWWGVIEDEYTYLQELAKTMYPPKPASMAQIYSFYVSNVKKELSFCDNNFVEMELRNSVFNETIFAEINDWVDLLDPIFGLNNSQEETVLSEEEINMEFE